MSRASRKANRESARRANNAKVTRSGEKSYFKNTTQKQNKTEELLKKFRERNRT